MSCSVHDDVAGGSDHPNEIVGTVLFTEGNTGTKTAIQVALYRASGEQASTALLRNKVAGSFASTIPVRVSSVACNSLGEYRFDSIPNGEYLVQAYAQDSSEQVLSAVFSLPAANAHDTLNKLQMQVSGSIRFFVGAPANPKQPDTLYLQGTPFYALVDSLGFVVFPFVPQGSFFTIKDLSNPTMNYGSKAALSGSCVQPSTCPSASHLDTIQVDANRCIVQWSCLLNNAAMLQLSGVDSLALKTDTVYWALSIADSGARVIVPVLGVVKISLDQNISTGYSWQTTSLTNPLAYVKANVYDTSLSSSSSNISSSSDSTYAPVITGQPSQLKIYLKVNAPMDRWLVWNYQRSTDTTAMQTFRIELVAY